MIGETGNVALVKRIDDHVILWLCRVNTAHWNVQRLVANLVVFDVELS